MRVAVLGASGGVGQQLVRQGIDRGHDVVGVVRVSSQLDVPEGVVVRRGPLDDADFLADVFADCDAVASGLGLKTDGLSPFAKVEDPTFLRRSTAAIVTAMKETGRTRLVVVSAGGAGDSYEWMPGVFKAMIKTTSMRKVYPELTEMERVFLASGLDVCSARPSGLTDGPKTGETRVVTKFEGDPRSRARTSPTSCGRSSRRTRSRTARRSSPSRASGYQVSRAPTLTSAPRTASFCAAIHVSERRTDDTRTSSITPSNSSC